MSSPTVVYGSSATISGRIGHGGEAVAPTSQPLAGKGAQSLMSTLARGGRFTFDVSPTIATSYQVHVRGSDSVPVTVKVAPRIDVARHDRVLDVGVVSDLSYQHRYVWVQRRTAGRGWAN